MNDFLCFQIMALLLTVRAHGCGSDLGRDASLRLQGYVDALFHADLITAGCASAIDDLSKNAGLSFYSNLGRDWAVSA
jgi:hypothetical protein